MANNNIMKVNYCASFPKVYGFHQLLWQPKNLNQQLLIARPQN